jgi:hypothetical protein
MTNLHAKYKDCRSKEYKVIGRTRKIDGLPDVRTDKLIPVYPPYNFVVPGYKNIKKSSFKISKGNIF